MAEHKITLGYWPAPGKAQVSRYLLELAGEEYNDVRYTNAADWFGRDKFALGLEFPNLPYILDGDVKLTESETIFEYLIHRLKKTELLGKEADKFHVHLLRNLISDIGTKLYILTTKEGEEKTKYLNEQIAPKFKYIHTFLGTKEYLVGYFTAADIYLFGSLNGFKKLAPEAFE